MFLQFLLYMSGFDNTKEYNWSGYKKQEIEYLTKKSTVISMCKMAVIITLGWSTLLKVALYYSLYG